MTLEHAFYIIGIVTMSLMLVLMISLVAAVLVIKSKINHLHRMVEDKVQMVSSITETAKSIFGRRKN
jgi:hypothetical protein